MPLSSAGLFRLGGDLPVHRLGYGAMRLCGPGVWGWPADRDVARRVLHRALELGVDLIDTADAYGPAVNEEQIADALHPYPPGLVIATKGGSTRPGPGQWGRDGRPEHLREAIAASLRRLKRDQIQLYQLHAVDPDVRFEDTVGALAKAREDGLVRHVGLSNVSVDQIERARRIVPIVSVQNRYNLFDRSSQAVLDHCTKHDLAFLPWYPLGSGDLARATGPLVDVARKHDATPAQVALAWLLAQSTVVLPIPGTASVAHLEENLGAADVRLDADDLRALRAVRA
jgi:aryl-alcohol dehydrogenase-like predicted oxidoreductase